MHYLAGVLLIAECVLLFVLEKTVVYAPLDWIGAGVWAFAMALIVLAISTLRRRGNVAPDASFVATHTLVTGGIFGIVRHPLYLGWSVMYLVPICFNPRWELVILAVVGMAAVQFFAREEERILVRQYGDAYLSYARSVPGMNILAGIARALRRRAPSAR